MVFNIKIEFLIEKIINPGFIGFLDYLFFLKILFIYSSETHREGGRDTGEGEAGSMQGVQLGTRFWVSRITPWTEGSAKPLSHQGNPFLTIFEEKR